MISACEEYAFCRYVRIGTMSEWHPMERDKVIRDLQKRIADLEKKLAFVDNVLQ